MNKSLVNCLVAVLAILQTCSGLHYYLNSGETRCFYESLPKHTLVVGKVGALQWDDHNADYVQSNDVSVEINVMETFDNDHKVAGQRISGVDTYHFTSFDPGEHKFCLTPYSNGRSSKPIRIHFDVALGSAHDYVDSKSTKKVDLLTASVQLLNKKLEEIHFELEHIREREAFFRDQSEATNSRVVKWTFIQIVVLASTCFYQLRHLMSFFVKQKIV